MLGVMAISFKRTYVDGCSVVSCDFGALPGENAHATAPRTVVFSSPDPTTGHCQPMPPPETPGYSQASLAQSLIGSLLLSSGSGAHKVLCALQESSSPALWKFCNQIPLAFKLKFLMVVVPMQDLQVGKYVVDSRIFTILREILWYNCFPVCGSSA